MNDLIPDEALICFAPILLVLSCIYILVFFAIIADLFSGIRKARKRHEERTSYGLRRTVEKMAKYYNLMFALTIIDLMQMIGLWYLVTYYGMKFPLFPIVSFIGAIGLGLVEIKSIFEKAEDKTRKDAEQIVKLIGDIAGNSHDYKKIADAVVIRMRKKEEEKNE